MYIRICVHAYVHMYICRNCVLYCVCTVLCVYIHMYMHTLFDACFLMFSVWIPFSMQMCLHILYVHYTIKMLIYT